VIDYLLDLQRLVLPLDPMIDFASAYAQSLFENAQRAYVAGQWQIALGFADKAVAANPRNNDALHLRGLIALALAALSEAQTWLTRAIQLLPHPIYCISLCVTQTRLQDYATAADTARQGLTLARERVPSFDTTLLWYNLGVALQLDDQPEAAAESYRQTLARQPGHAAAHDNLGTVSKDLGDLATAIAHFEQSIALNPRNVQAHSNLEHALLGGRALRGGVAAAAPAAQGRDLEAMAASECALEIDPHCVDAHVNCAVVLTRAERLDEAGISLRTVLDLEPGHAIAEFNLSVILLKKARYEEGWRLHEARNAIDGRTPAPFDAVCRQWQGESLQAKALIV
jgi:tetratricopeptide (TPR) repeat protein